MKIGFIGNMNNNNFALMRYCRDLGVDAHLLLYSNDGHGALKHFAPNADTWEIEKWQPFIHQTDIPNTIVAALGFPISTLLNLRSRVRRVFGMQQFIQRGITLKQIRKAYSGYDRLVGSGVTPAALARVGRSLDVFYPYGSGVEFLGAGDFGGGNNQSLFRKIAYKRVRKLQLKGLFGARCIINTDSGITGKVLRRYSLPSLQKTVPMVYNREKFPEQPPNSILAQILLDNCGSGFTVLHHARLMWVKNKLQSDSAYDYYSKNSHWFINAFAKLCITRPAIQPRLLIVEYGPDVVETKQLVSHLRIDKFVTWLPKMARRDLLWILKRVSIGVGEFHNSDSLIWGGTGWESLASGRALLQAFKFAEGEFEAFYGFPPPPMLAANSESEIFQKLLFACDCPKAVQEIGLSSLSWFNRYNGINLAKEWLKLIAESRADKTGWVLGK
jgi:hypothetical protein